MSQTRRGFFGRLGLLGAGSVFSIPRLGSAATSPGNRAGVPRHIIHMVADGMSWGTLTLADHLSWLTRKHGLSWIDLSRHLGAANASMNMRSLNSIVTDSSAAASSWGSGSRVENGVVNQLPGGKALTPICRLFAEASWKRGLVTTTEITHATPAGFAASVPSRGQPEDIADQYLQEGMDVLLGGGSKYFSATTRKDKKDLFAGYRKAGYSVFSEASELEAASPSTRWLGTFYPGHLPFSLDAAADEKLRRKVPTLARMTELALGKLERESHFFLMVEGGRVDHGAHGCDIAAALHDLIAFDEALDVCLAFQRRTPETLIVVTTDHGTGNPGLNGMGSSYEKSTSTFHNILKVRRSAESMASEFTAKSTASSIQSLLKEATGWKVPDDKAWQFAGFLASRWQPLLTTMNSASAQLGQLMGNYLGVGWSGSQHTADYVPLIAHGPGSDRFRGFVENVDVFRHYVDLAGIDFRNPSME